MAETEELEALRKFIYRERPDLHGFPFKDILYFHYDGDHEGKRGVWLVMPAGDEFKLGKFEFWLDLLWEVEDLPFEKVDRNAAVNIDKVKKFDKKNRWLYFEENPTRTSAKCSITKSHMRRLSTHLDRFTK
ncbi:hypothetical protein [Paenibacillus sp. MMO-58]|uniref:hypothetical protein n=1 Tax=Paenibacillus sp. MMO-58 TaxID=3081290 RepID=UPI003018073A